MRDKTPRISDSVDISKNWRSRPYVNLHALRGPMRHFFDRVGRSESGPRLPLESEATFAQKVTCFTVHFPAGSHDSRAAAPYNRESSIGVQILGGARTPLPGMPKCTVIYVTFAILCLTSLIILRIPTENNQTARDCTQKTSVSHAVFDGSSRPPK